MDNDKLLEVIATDHLPILYDHHSESTAEFLVIATGHLPILYGITGRGTD